MGIVQETNQSSSWLKVLYVVSKFLASLTRPDNVINQRLLLNMLSRLGYKADLASNGKAAVEKAQAEHFPLIFMGLGWHVVVVT